MLYNLSNILPPGNPNGQTAINPNVQGGGALPASNNVQVSSQSNLPWYNGMVSPDVQKTLQNMPGYVSPMEDGQLQDQFKVTKPEDYAGDINDLYFGADGNFKYDVNTGQIGHGENWTKGQNMIDSLTGTANSQGLTSHGQSLFDSQRLEEAGARDYSMKQADQGAASALDMLAMRGGFDSGARERAMRQAARDKAFGLQNVHRQGQMDRAGIRTDDEAYKKQLKSDLVGMNLDYNNQDLGMKQYNNTMQYNKDVFNANNALQAQGQVGQAMTNQYNTGYNADVINANNALNANSADNNQAWNQWQTIAGAIGGEQAAKHIGDHNKHKTFVDYGNEANDIMKKDAGKAWNPVKGMTIDPMNNQTKKIIGSTPGIGNFRF